MAESLHRDFAHNQPLVKFYYILFNSAVELPEAPQPSSEYVTCPPETLT